MDITVTIQTNDQRFVRAIMDGRNLTNRLPVPLVDGLEIVHLTGDAFGVTKNQVWKFLISGVTSASINVASSYIYDHLKDEQHSPVVQINNQFVEVRADSITDALQKSVDRHSKSEARASSRHVQKSTAKKRPSPRK